MRCVNSSRSSDPTIRLTCIFTAQSLLRRYQASKVSAANGRLTIPGRPTGKPTVDTATSKKIKEKSLHEKLFATAGTGPDDHIYGKNRVHRHIDKHERGDTATFIQQHEQNKDVEGKRVKADHQPAARSFDSAQLLFELPTFFF
jgi:hypothetical protein